MTTLNLSNTEQYPHSQQQIHNLHAFCKSLPKIELHAHLNGSIREHTLVDLASKRNVRLPPSLLQHDSEHHNTDKEAMDAKLLYNTRPRSLRECFEIFSHIPQCVTDIPSLRRITREVLEDAADDNVAYIEIRTGPKILLEDHFEDRRCCSKMKYVQTIIDVMAEFEGKERMHYENQVKSLDKSNTKNFGTNSVHVRLPLIPRLIISVDRSKSVDEAEEVIDLAIRLHTNDADESKGKDRCAKYVVGVELGGNPARNDFRMFRHLFEKARGAGLKVAIHCGEIPCADVEDRINFGNYSTNASFDKNDTYQDDTSFKAYLEAASIIDFHPDRLGHALLLPHALMQKLLLESSPIPIECCPTSNTMTLELARYPSNDKERCGCLVDGMLQHPQLRMWLEHNYPISINTDDSGIFCTNLTKEYLLVGLAFEGFNLNKLNGKSDKSREEDKMEGGIRWRLTKILLESVEHIFETNDMKCELQMRIRERVQCCL